MNTHPNTTEPIVVTTSAQLQAVVCLAVAEAIAKQLPQAIQRGIAKPYMTKLEVMDLTGWSSRQVEYKKQRRELPFIRRGRTVLFPTDDVYAYLESGRVPARGK
ncbi:MAG: hypothetical protein RhofKO_19650 [Rhodothermales bacterium]